jgi:hypothetical protein
VKASRRTVQHAASGFAAAVALFCAPLRADTVEMKETGLKLEGKVERETEEYIVLRVHNDSGAVRIPKTKIKAIEYDIKTQLENVGAEDGPGRFRVGKWALEKGLTKDAIAIFEALNGAEGVPPERFKLLGQAHELRQDPDNALKAYSDFLKAVPGDAEVQARVAALQEAQKTATAAANTGNTGNTETPGKKQFHNGLEATGTWITENWGHPGKTQVVADKANPENKVVTSVCEGGDKDKYAVTRFDVAALNLTDSKEILFKMFHDSPTPLLVAVAFQNNAGEFHETRQFRVPGNTWDAKTMKIEGKVFKANRNNFQEFNLELQGKEAITKLMFLVYGQRKFNLFIDDVYFK